MVRSDLKNACSASTCAKGVHVRKNMDKKQAGKVHHNLSSARFEETVDGVRVLIGAPGVRAQDLEVRQDELTLCVKGQTERGVDTFYIVDQQIELPSCIDLDSAQCTHANGVLTIELKKKVGKTIPVSVGVEVDPAKVSADEPASAAASDNEFQFE